MKFCALSCLAMAVAAMAQVNQNPQPAFPTPPVKEISPGPARSIETNAVRPAERTTATNRLRSAGAPGRTSGVERSQTNAIPRTNAPFTPPGITNVLPGLNTTPAGSGATLKPNLPTLPGTQATEPGLPPALPDGQGALNRLTPEPKGAAPIAPVP